LVTNLALERLNRDELVAMTSMCLGVEAVLEHCAPV